MADIVKVQIVGEITDLKSKIAAAKADVRSFEDEIAHLSDEIAAGGTAAEQKFGGALQTASINLIRAATNVQNLEDKLAKVAPAMAKTGAAATDAGKAVGGMVDELASGAAANVPAQMGASAAGIGLLGAAAGIAVVGVQALAGALISMVQEAIRASEAVSKIELGAAMANNAAITRASIQQTIADIENLYGVSREDAEKIAAAFATLRNSSEQQFRALSGAVGQYLSATGRDADQVIGKVTELMRKQRVTIEDLEGVFPGLTREQYASYAATAQVGTATERAAAMSQLFLDYLRSASPQIAEYNAGMHRSWANWLQYVLILSSGIPYQEVHDALVQQNTKSWNEHAAAIQKDIDAMKGLKPSTDEILIAADRAAQAQNRSNDRIAQTRKEIKDLEEGLKVARATETGDALARDIAKYSEALNQARQNLAQLERERKNQAEAGTRIAGEQLINEARLSNAQIAADDTIAKQEQLQRQIQTWDVLLSGDRITAQQRVQVERERAQALRQLHNAEAAEERAAARQRADIARDTARTDLEISRVGIAERRAQLEELVQAHRITEQQKLEEMRQLAIEELQLNLRVLDNSISTYEADEKEFARVENQKRLLRAQTAAEIAKIDAQIEQANNRAAREDMRAWRDATNVLLAAQRTFVQGVFQSNESIGMIALRTIDMILQKEIEADLAYLTKHALFKQEEMAADATAEQGGLLVKMFTESEKTAATASGAAARGAIHSTEAATENAGFIVRLARWVATELGLTASTATNEAARTGATTAGEATRLGEKAAFLAAGKAMETAYNVSSALSYSAVAANGAAAAVAWVPLIGPALALAAASSTFASLQPFVALAALETGTTDVPRDMPAYLHQGEMVVPKTFAQGIRSMMSASPPVQGLSTPAGRSIVAGDNHVTYAPTINAPQQKSLRALIEEDGSYFRTWFQAQVREGALKPQTS